LIVVPYIREILGGIIFFKNKKNLVAHLAHPFFELKVLVLLTNSCAKPFGTVGTNGDFIDFFAYMPWHTSLLDARGKFLFQKNLYRGKNSPYIEI
tara:strand:+ start:555 stop:839 length:285 start_codon:yes stop_codon:yes gene_type:complete